MSSHGHVIFLKWDAFVAFLGFFQRNRNSYFSCLRTIGEGGVAHLTDGEPIPPLPATLKERIEAFQRDEVTEYRIYRMLARASGNDSNAKVLSTMADQELGHYRFWRAHTGIDTSPSLLKVWGYYLTARIFGLTFAIKLMEGREGNAIRMYRDFTDRIIDIEKIIADEEHHEKEIIAFLDEEKLHYLGSIVLGLNDALVEFTGSLAGFTFALQDTTIIAAVGSIMGVAAALSMGASEYLSQKADPGGQKPVKAALYTAIAYILTVFILVVPFLLTGNPFLALAVTLFFAVGIILCFTFYTSVAQGLPFGRRFFEMAALSLGIAGISFLIGLLIRVFFQVDV